MPRTRVLDLPALSASHAHPEHQLIVGLEGCADFDIGGQGGAVSRLHACLVPGDTAHAFSGRGHNHMLILDIDLTEISERDSLLLRLFEKPRFVALDGRLQGLLDFASSELTALQPDTPLGWHLGNTLLHAVHDRVFDDSAQQRPPLDLNAIDRFILSNLEASISVADLARQVHVSPSHFFSLFRRATGHSPHQYIQRCRVSQAVQWLRAGELPIAEIASRTGFCSQSALTHATRRHLGLTPGAIRQRAAHAS